MSKSVSSHAAGPRTDRGATAVEYAIMASLIAMVIFAAVSLLGTNLSSLFNSAADAF